MKKYEEKINVVAEKFILNPEKFLLFRGEQQFNHGGQHFTTDKEWAKNFGDKILEGQLPIGSKVRLITGTDFADGFKQGFGKEWLLWNFIFSNEECDALIGHDAMNCRILDVIVNPKHLKNFKHLDEAINS